MADPFHDLYARVVVEHALAVEPGHTLLIESTTTGAPLADAVHRRALEAGAHPTVLLRPEGWVEARVECASDAVIEEPDWLLEVAYERVDRRLNVVATTNTRETSAFAASRVAAAYQSRHRALSILLRRDAAGEARWCVAQYPTEGLAQEAGMSLGEYRDLLGRALLLDRPDPVAAWRCVAQLQARIVARLSRVDHLRFVAPGTDLRMRVAGRRWISAHGSHNLPDGEVFTGPVEDSVEGQVSYTFPLVWYGRVVTGARLRFEGGRVVEASAESGEDFLREALDLDEGARRLGEIALGLNDGIEHPTGDVLFDEKIGGSFHAALGSSYVETGGVNESDLHWDMVCDLRDGGEIHADGELVYRDGRFLPGVLDG
jgi:aminopeptidase